MKVFFIVLTGDNELFEENRGRAFSIKEKVDHILIDLAYLPTLDMEVDLSSFTKEFNFSEEEYDLLENSGIFKIKHLTIHCDALQISISI